MVPGIYAVSSSEAAELSRSVPVPPAAPLQSQGVATPQQEPSEKFQPVRIGPLFENATSEQDETVANSDRRVELDAYAEKITEDRNAETRALQQKLYTQF